jgi:hypothetical protein
MVFGITYSFPIVVWGTQNSINRRVILVIATGNILGSNELLILIYPWACSGIVNRLG